MKALILNPLLDDAQEIDLTDKRSGRDWLKQVYWLIGTECIDIVQRKIGSSDYEIVCDDEYLLTHNEFIPSYFDNKKKAIVYGTIIICGLADDDGNLTSLTDDEILELKLHLVTIRERDYNQNGELIKRTFLIE